MSDRIAFHETTISTDPHGYSDIDFGSIRPAENIQERLEEMRSCRRLQDAMVEWRDDLGVEMTEELCQAWRVLMHATNLEYVYRRYSVDRAEGGYAAVRNAGL